LSYVFICILPTQATPGIGEVVLFLLPVGEDETKKKETTGSGHDDDFDWN
jgi:hypothetical protein